MNKKVTIFAVVLIIIGIVGTISSSIAAIPFVTNYTNEIIKDMNEEVVIYEKVVDTKNIIVETKDTDVEIKPSNSDKLIIKQRGKNSNVTFTLDNKKDGFNLKQNYKEPEFTIQGLCELALDNMNVAANKIVIYVPNKVDIQVKTESGTLIVEDKNILLDKLGFNTTYGKIILPKEVKSLKNLNISSLDSVNLKASEILGIENVNISTDGSVYIESMPDDIFIENIENYIPKNVNIISARYGADIHIATNMPIAQNLIIDNKGGYVGLNLPIDNYNLNFNLLTSEKITLHGGNQDSNTEDAMKTKFEGTFREARENEFKYNVEVKAANIDLTK